MLIDKSKTLFHRKRVEANLPLSYGHSSRNRVPSMHAPIILLLLSCHGKEGYSASNTTISN